MYRTCGFYLCEITVKLKNLVFYKPIEKMNIAYCHMFMVPLNLEEKFFNLGEKSLESNE